MYKISKENKKSSSITLEIDGISRVIHDADRVRIVFHKDNNPFPVFADSYRLCFLPCGHWVEDEIYWEFERLGDARTILYEVKNELPQIKIQDIDGDDDDIAKEVAEKEREEMRKKTEEREKKEYEDTIKRIEIFRKESIEDLHNGKLKNKLQTEDGRLVVVSEKTNVQIVKRTSSMYGVNDDYAIVLKNTNIGDITFKVFDNEFAAKKEIDSIRYCLPYIFFNITDSESLSSIYRGAKRDFPVISKDDIVLPEAIQDKETPREGLSSIENVSHGSNKDEEPERIRLIEKNKETSPKEVETLKVTIAELQSIIKNNQKEYEQSIKNLKNFYEKREITENATLEEMQNKIESITNNYESKIRLLKQEYEDKIAKMESEYKKLAQYFEEFVRENTKN